MTLKHRLDSGLEYIKKNPKAVVIVTGGQGNGEDIPEALAMERYLVARGVPPSKIFREEKSESTYENFVFSKKILDSYYSRGYSVAFVTSDFHIFRAKEISKMAGLSCTYNHADIEWYLVPIAYIREFAAMIKVLIFQFSQTLQRISPKTA